MTLDIVLPEINKKPKNTKDAVISALTTEWPLTLKNIFYKIKKQYRYSYTYQSVYKAVKELCISKVLKQNSNGYEINIDWIKNVQSFTDVVETNYYAKQRIHNISGLKDSNSGEDLIILNFETIFDAEKYLYYFIKQELFKSKNIKICFQLNNEWRPIFYLRAEYNYYKRLLKRGHKFLFVCSGNSYLEKISKEFYKSIGINYKLSKQKFTCDMFVFSEYFIQIFIPEELKKKMKEYLDKRDILNLLKNVLEKKSSIRVIINKDASLAKEIIKKIERG